jgi:hypothetical protein
MSDEQTEFICLPCWRTEVSMHDAPPQTEAWYKTAMEPTGARGSKWEPPDFDKCAWCERPTNHGIRVPVEGFWL